VILAMMSMMIIMTGLEMTTTGLNSNDNKTEYNCGVNKKSNRNRDRDSDNNCEVDDNVLIWATT
jgi:hypothetical protein